MIRRTILKAAYPFVRWVGKAHAPWTHKLVHATDVDEALSCLEGGDTIITYTFGEATNLVIPGRWKHAAIYVGEGMVIEARDPCVRVTDIYDFMMTKDYVAIMRPQYKPLDLDKSVRIAGKLIGKPYDYLFEIERNRPNPAFYCAELPFWCYVEAEETFPFVLRDMMGVPTVVPDDYYKAKAVFTKVWSNRNDNELAVFMKEKQ